MNNIAELIDALGGHRRVAAALRLPAGTVSSWKSRGTIPSRAWSRLVAHARKDNVPGVDLEKLAALNSRAARDRTRQPATRANLKSSISRGQARMRIDKELLAEAAELGIDLSALADDILREAVKNEKVKRWQIEHADVIAWYNEHIERDGIFGEEWRTF